MLPDCGGVEAKVSEELTPYEKMLDGVAQFATLIRTYYVSLTESGFSHDDAMVLTMDYQKELVAMMSPNRGQENN